MLSFERKNQIIEILKQHQSVTVKDLSSKLYSSEATIRRDLAQLDADGAIKRVRGGAVLIEGSNNDLPVLLRTNKEREKKEKIAQLALSYVKNSTTIFMDPSSTVTTLAYKLNRFHDITVVTNGIAVLNVLNENTSLKVISSGGVIYKKSSFIGQQAIENIEMYHADLFFFSCCGFSLQCGSTEASEQNAAVKKAMCKNAKKRILLCDSTKIGSDFFCKACDTKDIDVIITDKRPSREFLEGFRGIWRY